MWKWGNWDLLVFHNIEHTALFVSGYPYGRDNFEFFQVRIWFGCSVLSVNVQAWFWWLVWSHVCVRSLPGSQNGWAEAMPCKFFSPYSVACSTCWCVSELQREVVSTLCRNASTSSKRASHTSSNVDHVPILSRATHWAPEWPCCLPIKRATFGPPGHWLLTSGTFAITLTLRGEPVPGPTHDFIPLAITRNSSLPLVPITSMQPFEADGCRKEYHLWPPSPHIAI